MASVLGFGLGGLPMYATATPPAFGSLALDQTTDQWESILQQRVADTITHVGFRYSLRTGTPPAYKASIQGVNTSGNPDGTILGGGTPASHVFTPPADTTWDATWQWIALDNSIALTRGQFISIVVAYSSGTVDGSNFSTLNNAMSGLQARAGFPYFISNNAGARTRSALWPIVAMKSASAVYGFPIQTFTQTLFSSDSTPDEYALSFSLPAGSCTSYQVAGVRFWTQVAAGKSLIVNLYTGTTVLQTVTLDSDDFSVNASADRSMEVWFTDSSLTTLSPGTTYRVGLQPQQTTSNTTVMTLDCAAAADLGAYPGGTAWALSTRTDAGAWTDVATSRPMVELILTDLTATAGGGGMLVHPGMSGARG